MSTVKHLYVSLRHRRHPSLMLTLLRKHNQLFKIKTNTNYQCVNKLINNVNLEKVLQNITQVGRVVHIVPVEDRQFPQLCFFYCHT